MSNKARKYYRKYIIEVEGISRGFKNEPTFQEEVIDGIINTIILSIKKFYKTAKVKFSKFKEKK